MQREIAKIQGALGNRQDVIAAYLFGSMAHGKAHALSDVDVAVLFTHGLDQVTIFQRTLEIGTTLEQALCRPVDVVALNHAPTLLRFQVIKSGKLILERDRTQRCTFQMQTMSRYYDIRPYLQEQIRYTMQRIQKEGLGGGYHGHRNALEEARRLRAKLAPVASGTPE